MMENEGRVIRYRNSSINTFSPLSSVSKGLDLSKQLIKKEHKSRDLASRNSYKSALSLVHFWSLNIVQPNNQPSIRPSDGQDFLIALSFDACLLAVIDDWGRIDIWDTHSKKISSQLKLNLEDMHRSELEGKKHMSKYKGKEEEIDVSSIFNQPCSDHGMELKPTFWGPKNDQLLISSSLIVQNFSLEDKSTNYFSFFEERCSDLYRENYSRSFLSRTVDRYTQKSEELEITSIKSTKTLRIHPHLEVSDAQVSSCGDFVSAVGEIDEDGMTSFFLKVWHLSESKLLHSKKLFSSKEYYELHLVQSSRDDRIISFYASPNSDQEFVRIQVWDLPRGKLIYEIEEHGDFDDYSGLNEDIFVKGDYLFTLCNAYSPELSKVKVRSLDTGSLLYELEIEDWLSSSLFSISLERNILVYVEEERMLKVRELKSGKLLLTNDFDLKIRSISISDDGQFLALLDERNIVQGWQIS